jgi:hypothetical protein
MLNGDASEEYFAAINRRIQVLRREIQAHGFTVADHGDPADFVAARQRFPGYAHPAFDPTAGAEFEAGSFYWLSLRKDGDLHGVIASRLLCGPLAQLLHRRQFWGFDRPSIADIQPFPIAAGRELKKIRGRVSYQGGLVLSRTAIRLGIATSLVRLVRVASYRHWSEDWQCAFYLTRTDPHGRRFKDWGYPHSETLFDRPAGPVPRASHDREMIAYVSGSEILDEIIPVPVADFIPRLRFAGIAQAPVALGIQAIGAD